MKITANLQEGKLLIRDAVYPISCSVRSIKNGTRRSSEVIRSIPDNRPYDPQPFPVGTWNVTAVEWQNVGEKNQFDYNTYGPCKIRTDACQWVHVWRLDKDGDYQEETAQLVNDKGYLLHYTVSSTTLGCIRLNSPENAVKIGRIIEKLLSQGEKIEIEVI